MVILKIFFHIFCIISKLFYKLCYRSKLCIGKKTTWRKHLSVIIFDNGKVTIGDNCFFNNYCSINSCNSVRIGNDCLFGENVKIYDHNHKFREQKPIKEQGYSNGEVTIGNNCWIGSNTVILKGAKIGNHCVIGAGCVVNCEIPNDTVFKLSNDNYSVAEIKKSEDI